MDANPNPAEEPETLEEATQRLQNVQELADWLTSLPQDTHLEWGEDNFSIHPQAKRASFIDVYIPQAHQDLGLSWVLTIIPASDTDAKLAWPTVDNTTMIVEPDVSIWCTTDDNWYTPDGAALTAKGQDPSLDQLEALMRVQEANNSDFLGPIDAWRLDTLSKAIQTWAEAHTNRKDLKFTHQADLKTAFLEKVEQAAAEMDKARENGETPGYLLGEADGVTVRASDQVMDQLLALDGDQAGKITGQIIKIVNNQIKNPGSPPSKDESNGEGKRHGKSH